MEEKVKRFIELSKEFTIDSSQIFEFIPQNFTLSYATNCCSNQVSRKTRLELLKENLEREASRAERFEEYLKLQADLSEYYNALEKLQ